MAHVFRFADDTALSPCLKSICKDWWPRSDNKVKPLRTYNWLVMLCGSPNLHTLKQNFKTDAMNLVYGTQIRKYFVKIGNCNWGDMKISNRKDRRQIMREIQDYQETNSTSAFQDVKDSEKWITSCPPKSGTWWGYMMRDTHRLLIRMSQPSETALYQYPNRYSA